VAFDGATETVLAFGSEGSNQAPSLSGNQAYVLRLYSIAPKRRLLARLRVDQTVALEVVGLPLPPKETSAAVDRIMQLLAFGWVVLGGLLVSMFVREIRRGH
jgi:hypothetical protein